MSKEIECKNNCRMTKALRESKYCTGKAKITDEGIVFGCQNELKAAAQEERNLLTCIYDDMGIEEKCFTCPLKCKNNKNKNMETREIEAKELNKILSSMNTFGVNADYAYDIVDKHKKSGTMDIETLKALGFSNNLLSKGMSGSSYDISHFHFIMRNFIKKIKKKDNKK